MVLKTSVLQIPYPELIDDANVPEDMKALADRTEFSFKAPHSRRIGTAAVPAANLSKSIEPTLTTLQFSGSANGMATYGPGGLKVPTAGFYLWTLEISFSLKPTVDGKGLRAATIGTNGGDLVTQLLMQQQGHTTVICICGQMPMAAGAWARPLYMTDETLTVAVDFAGCRLSI